MKQDALAAELGDDWSQRRISLLEAKDQIEQPILEQVATILKVPVEAITHLEDGEAVNIISNTFNENAVINSTGTFNINPVEKWMEVFQENKELYERLLQTEREKNALLEKLLDKLK